MCLLLKGTMSSGGERVWSVGACNPTWETTAPQVWTTLAERKRRRRRRTGWQLNGHCALGLTSTGNGNELMDFLWGRNNLSDDDFNKSWNVDAVTEGLTWASWNSGLKNKDILHTSAPLLHMCTYLAKLFRTRNLLAVSHPSSPFSSPSTFRQNSTTNLNNLYGQQKQKHSK